MAKTAAYLGPVASFSHQAALALFPPNSTSTSLTPLQTFADIFDSLISSDSGISYGVIPFENSSNGAVLQTLDLLADRTSQYTNIRVVGEYYLTVHHSLLVAADTSVVRSAESDLERLGWVKKLYTHPQAWGQCEKFLTKRFRGVERQDVSSTSKAADLVSHDEEHKGTVAAIASRLAAEVHGLDILAENIEDDEGGNVTRFFVFARTDLDDAVIQNDLSFAQRRSLASLQTSSISPKSDSTDAKKRRLHGSHNNNNIGTSPEKPIAKSLISFTVNHIIPGALAKALEVFQVHGLNLTSIDTRPSRQRNWHYIFFVECERAMPARIAGNGSMDGVSTSEGMDGALKDLAKVVEEYRFWGQWDDRL